jgi:ATP-binding cassette subfamily B protein
MRQRIKRLWSASLYRQMFSGLWHSNPVLTTVLAVTVIVSAGLLVVVVVTAGAIVRALPAAVAAGVASPAAGHAWQLVALLAVAIGLLQTVGSLQGAVVPTLARRFEGHLRERVMRASQRPASIAHLYDDEIREAIGAATTVGTANFGPASAVTSLPVVVGSLLNGAVMAVIVATYRWWLGVLLGVAWLIARDYRRKDIIEGMRTLGSDSPGSRRLSYLRQLVLAPSAGKEIRVFGLGSWLVERFHAQWLDSIQQAWQDRRTRRPRVLPTLAVLLAANAAAAVVIVRAAATGSIDIGRLAVLLQATIGVALIADMGGVTVHDMVFAYSARTVAGVDHLESLLPAAPVSATQADKPTERPPAPEICFTDISFRYDTTHSLVLCGLQLRLPAGRSVAIVGENGAGKTTLVRLLCGLIAPEAGTITVDGKPLTELSLDTWRRRIAVVFQDFARFHTTARDNIDFTALPSSLTDDELATVAALSGVSEVVASLPHGWDTVLTRDQPGGVDLSGGQWQRVALARAIHALEGGASVLVLDEPTSSLDIRAEAAFYNEFLRVTEGLTTLIISHRFATVRRADVICVLSDGAIAETGSHEELLALDGRYAHMFRDQAALFANRDAKS